jgi:ubiquinone/menaquinone biosynthesis C-methylase UbiE
LFIKENNIGGFYLAINKNKNISNFLINCRRILSCYYYNFLELLAVKTRLFQKLLMSWRRPVFLNEIKMAKINKKDKVLLIGCGIFPSETILIAEQTGANVVGIDNSPQAVKIAKKYVKKKELSNLVKIEYGDGKEYPLSDFNVIFIAINVWPIDSVLKHILKDMKPDGRVMCKSLKNDIISVIEKEKFDIISKLENPQTQSFLLKKKR